MGIARISTSSGNATGTSISWSHTVASGSNRALFVGVLENASGFTTTRITGITFNSVAMTKLVEHYRTFSDGQVASIWFLAAPDVTTANIVISLSASTDTHGFGANYTGVDSTAPTGTALKTFSSNSATDATMNPVTIADDSWAFSVFRNLDGSITDNTNYVGFVDGSVEAGDSNASTGVAGTITVTATRATNTRWGGCVTAAFAPAAADTFTYETLSVKNSSPLRNVGGYKSVSV